MSLKKSIREFVAFFPILTIQKKISFLFMYLVFSQKEVKDVFENLEGINKLMASLLYGTGMRLMECVRLRVKDVDFSNNRIIV